ncbi:MAG: EAL domain-containing protein, partial [Candidatus Omnitrophica bacterium]|nr:EAL domain-containing protein [Candidatus Omnitrophota bacterium]
LSIILASRGYKVITATSGRDAIEKSNLPIDLIVLDLFLPDISGLEVCHYLKNTETTRNIPIIVLSDRACAVNQKVQCFQLGADDFLVKPFDTEEFVVRVFALLRRNYGEDLQVTSQRMEQLKLIKEIVENGLVEPYFQPIYYVEKECRVFGAEVLSRPQVPGPLSAPEVLFTVAFDLGLYYELETMVWKKALNVIGRNPLFPNIFFNCNPHLIENAKSDQIQKIFNDRSFDPKNVYFELTERSAIVKYELFWERLKEYRQVGFNIVVDDVGSGYASLGSIIETRPQIVKIDRHIIHGVLTDPLKSSIVKLVVSFCIEHDIICVAEGVETMQEFHLLRQFGVKAFQGYLFCRPEMIDHLNKSNIAFKNN